MSDHDNYRTNTQTPPVRGRASSNNHLPDEWIEIIDPQSSALFFANLRTGECVWDRPVNAVVYVFTALCVIYCSW